MKKTVKQRRDYRANTWLPAPAAALSADTAYVVCVGVAGCWRACVKMLQLLRRAVVVTLQGERSSRGGSLARRIADAASVECGWCLERALQLPKLLFEVLLDAPARS